MPENEENNDNGNGESRVQALAVGVCAVQVLCELAAIGLDIRHIMHFLAALQLFLAFGFSHEAVELFFALVGVDVNATEAARFTGREEGHGCI